MKHLNMYLDDWRAEDYDLQYSSDTYESDKNFWLSLITRYQPKNILELGVGTGRIAIPLVQSGFRVTGIDISNNMLKVALKRKSQELTNDEQQRLTLIQSDMKNFNVEKFDLIFIGLNSLGHLLETGEQKEFFKTVKRHLNLGGRFIVDVFNVNFLLKHGLVGTKNTISPTIITKHKNSQRNKKHIIHMTDFYDDVRELLVCSRVTQVYDDRNDGLLEKLYHTDFNLYAYSHDKLKSLFDHIELAVDETFGDHNFRDLEINSPKLIFVGKA